MYFEKLYALYIPRNITLDLTKLRASDCKKCYLFIQS